LHCRDYFHFQLSCLKVKEAAGFGIYMLNTSMNIIPHYEDYNPASENEEVANKPEWSQKVILPLKPDGYNYIQNREMPPGTTRPDKEDFSGAGRQEEDEAIIEFSHEQAMYMFYLAMGSFGITPNQMKKFADDIEAGNIVEPYPLR